jgi:hypothetical protein
MMTERAFACATCGRLDMTTSATKKYCSKVCNQRHLRAVNRGYCEAERQRKRSKYASDAQYRSNELRRNATWKIDHPEARREERRRARIREIFGNNAGADLYAMVEQLRRVFGNAADLEAAAAFVVAKLYPEGVPVAER